MSSLKDRRIEQCNELFELVASDLARELHHLLPAKNVSRYNLRNQREFTQPKMRTKRLSNRCLNGRTHARNFINKNGDLVLGPSYRPAGPVLGHKRERFITIFCYSITYKAFVLIFRSQIILKELCFMLEKEVSCTPSFSLRCSHSIEAKKSWVF